MKNQISFSLLHTMHTSPLLLSLVTLLILLLSVANAVHSPRRGVLNGGAHKSRVDVADFERHFYNQTLDHFNFLPESYATFQQKYLINRTYWGGPNQSAPIFAYLGAESPQDLEYPYIGFLPENAEKFKALLVYIEHRYYGDSMPFRSRGEAFKNASTLGYFNSAQAIADYAEVLAHVKKEFHAHNSPIIAVGGSYGGMLAAWFRLKYPHLVLGALASSAPILYFEDITPTDAFLKVVSKDFQDESLSCFDTIKRSWDEIDSASLQPNGLAILSQKFNTCSPLTDVSQLKNVLASLYTSAAQYNSDHVKSICHVIDDAEKDSDIITRIAAGVAGSSCLPLSVVPDESYEGWSWQKCTEMVMPMGCGNETMFFPSLFNVTEFIQKCKDTYGIEPRPHWVTSYYGGHDIKLVLKRFGSNIIFSNGLKDPYSSGGVVTNLSKSLVAITTEKGTHCMDIHKSSPTDPKWLVNQREKEIKVIRGWLERYYKDLQNAKIELF